MSSDLSQQIDQEIEQRAETGFTHSFSNGGHSTHLSQLSELLDAQERLERRQAARRGRLRLAYFDPNL